MENASNSEMISALEEALLDYVERFGPTRKVLKLYASGSLLGDGFDVNVRGLLPNAEDPEVDARLVEEFEAHGMNHRLGL